MFVDGELTPDPLNEDWVCQSALNFDQQTASNIDQGSALFFT